MDTINRRTGGDHARTDSSLGPIPDYPYLLFLLLLLLLFLFILVFFFLLFHRWRMGNTGVRKNLKCSDLKMRWHPTMKTILHPQTHTPPCTPTPTSTDTNITIHWLHHLLDTSDRYDSTTGSLLGSTEGWFYFSFRASGAHILAN
jgi:hypothetical protein